MGEIGTGHEDLLNGAEVAAAAEEKETHAFEVDPSQVMYPFKFFEIAYVSDIRASSFPAHWVTLPWFSSMCDPCSLIRQEALIGTEVYQQDLGHPVASLSLYWNLCILSVHKVCTASLFSFFHGLFERILWGGLACTLLIMIYQICLFLCVASISIFVFTYISSTSNKPEGLMCPLKWATLLLQIPRFN